MTVRKFEEFGLEATEPYLIQPIIQKLSTKLNSEPKETKDSIGQQLAYWRISDMAV